MVEEWKGERDPRDRRKTYRIDVHTHILPERWPDLKERYGYGGWVKLEHTACKGKARMFKGEGSALCIFAHRTRSTHSTGTVL